MQPGEHLQANRARCWCRHFNLGWGRVKSTLWHFMRLQSQFMNHLEIEVLPPYMPNHKVRGASPGSAPLPLSAVSRPEQGAGASLGVHCWLALLHSGLQTLIQTLNEQNKRENPEQLCFYSKSQVETPENVIGKLLCFMVYTCDNASTPSSSALAAGNRCNPVIHHGLRRCLAQEREDPRLYAESVRRLMAERLGARLSSHGLREQQALKRAGVCVDLMGRCVLPCSMCPPSDSLLEQSRSASSMQCMVPPGTWDIVTQKAAVCACMLRQACDPGEGEEPKSRRACGCQSEQEQASVCTILSPAKGFEIR